MKLDADSVDLITERMINKWIDLGRISFPLTMIKCFSSARDQITVPGLLSIFHTLSVRFVGCSQAAKALV